MIIMRKTREQKRDIFIAPNVGIFDDLDDFKKT